ncbi:MAG: hypothetical protein PHU75_06715 [Candidatus Nanopelagicales bacterium]|nr:hypothetical protein [Candidatus Nanopelagicales bacterium]
MKPVPITAVLSAAVLAGSLGAASAYAAPSPSATTPPASAARAATFPQPHTPASPAGSAPSWATQGVLAPASAGPLLAQAMQVYQTMKQTKYSHQYVINPGTGTYFWDCVGFTNWALKQATPNAWKAFHTAMNVPVGASGRVALWAQFLTGTPGPSWSVVNSVTALTGGELMIIPGEIVLNGKPQYGSSSSGQSYVGHAVIIAGPPTRLSDGTYAVATYDSTALPGHGQWDSRYTDPRALPLGPSTPTTFSGTGFGTMRLSVNASGAPTGVYWSGSAAGPIMFAGQPVVPVLARPLN